MVDLTQVLFHGCCQAKIVYGFHYPYGQADMDPTLKEMAKALKDCTRFGNISVAILRKNDQYELWKDALAKCGWVQLSNWVPGSTYSPIAIFGHCSRTPMEAHNNVT